MDVVLSEVRIQQYSSVVIVYSGVLQSQTVQHPIHQGRLYTADNLAVPGV